MYNGLLCDHFRERVVLKLYGNCNGISTDYKFEVMVRMDSDYAKYLDTRISMTGRVMYPNGAPVTFRSSTQKMVSFSSTEVELNAAVMGVQDALFVKSILKSLGLLEYCCITAHVSKKMKILMREDPGPKLNKTLDDVKLCATLLCLVS